MTKRLYTVSEAAEIIGVHPNTIKNWEMYDEWPQPLRTPGGHRRYTEEHIEAILHKMEEADEHTT